MLPKMRTPSLSAWRGQREGRARRGDPDEAGKLRIEKRISNDMMGRAKDVLYAVAQLPVMV